MNLPAAFLVLAVTGVLILGVRESARTNTVMVAIKLAVLLLFIVLGVTAFKADNFSPFFVDGLGGSLTAAIHRDGEWTFEQVAARQQYLRR